MVFKFLSKGKKSEYFLEAPPSTNGSEPATKVAEAKQAVTETLADAKQAADAQVDKLKATVARVADAVEDKVTDKGAEAKAAASKTTEATLKAKKFKKVKADAKTEAKPEAAPKPAKAAQPTPEPVKNFATDFLMPSATPRRRPGPSLEMFRSMAKDVSPRK